MTAGAGGSQCFSCVFLTILPSADIDECIVSPCDLNASCTNTLGSFTCACNPGYSGDGVTCNGRFLNLLILWLWNAAQPECLFSSIPVSQHCFLIPLCHHFVPISKRFCCKCIYTYTICGILLFHYGLPPRYQWMCDSVSLSCKRFLHQHTRVLHMCLQHGVRWQWTVVLW